MPTKKKPAKKPAKTLKKSGAAKKRTQPATKRPASRAQPAAKKKKAAVPAARKPAAAKKSPVAKKKPVAKGPRASSAAAQLLVLEQELRRGNTDPALLEKWSSLVTRVLGGKVGHNQRRSIRLPASVSVRLGIRKGEFVCQLTDLSQLGITVSGPVLAHIATGEVVELRAVGEKGAEHVVGMRTEVMRIDSAPTPPVAGLQLAHDNDAAAQGRYFEFVYYPLYLAYLESQARS